MFGNWYKWGILILIHPHHRNGVWMHGDHIMINFAGSNYQFYVNFGKRNMKNDKEHKSSLSNKNKHN